MHIAPAHLWRLDDSLCSDGTFLSCPPSTVGFYSFFLGQVLTPLCLWCFPLRVCVRVRLCVSALCLIAWWHVVHGKIDEHQPSDPKQNDLTTTLTWLQIRLDLRPPHHSLLEITKWLWKAVRTFTGLLKTVTRHAYLRRRLRQGVGDTKVFLWSRIEFPAGAGPPVPQSIFPLFCNWWSLQPLVLLIH